MKNQKSWTGGRSPRCRGLTGVIRRRRKTGEHRFRNYEKRLSPFGFGVHVLMNDE
jgi:hypothetical protein